MTTLSQVIVFILDRRHTATDRELSEAIYGSDRGHQQINQECRLLAGAGLITRTKQGDKPISNVRSQTVAKRPAIHLVQSSTA